MLISRGLIAASPSPEAVAGALAHALAHLEAGHPEAHLAALLGWGEIWELILGDGPVPGDAASTVAAALAARAHGAAEEAEAEASTLARLAAAGLPTAPYAALVAATLETSPAWARRHPLANRAARARAADSIGEAPFVPALSDRDWVALQGICG